MAEVFGCKYCGRNNFRSALALEQHQSHGLCAQRRMQEQDDENSEHTPMSFDAPMQEDDGIPMPFDSPPRPPQKQVVKLLDLHNVRPADVDAVTVQIMAMWDETIDVDKDNSDTSSNLGSNTQDSDQDEEKSDESDEESSGTTTDSMATDTSNTAGPFTWVRRQWYEYCARAAKENVPLTEDQVFCIKLLHILKHKDAPFNTYEALMRWHLVQSNKIREHQSLRDCKHYIGRKTIFKFLAKRYNFQNKYPLQKTVSLPVSGTKVRITCHNYGASLQRLLTDPRNEAQDYLFWDENPMGRPPENLNYVQDLNTGLAYLDTYDKLITKDNQQLMPIVLYCDGTAVSHFHDMEIIQVKISLGIFTREARVKERCWVPIGYIEKIHEQGGRGRKMLQEGDHLDTNDGQASLGSESTYWEADGVGDKSDQDFHAMMAIVLQEYLQFQERGFLWDQEDGRGNVTRGIHYLQFTPFVKADTKEADQFCGKFGQRSTTQQICRKCHIPLQRADDHMAKYPIKTEHEIQQLVENADIEGLRALSQTYLRNCFYNVQFSSGNDHGIHGSCPSELLHAFLLGIFKYLRDIFFELIGRTSESAKLINALAKIYGKLFARQSDRTLPSTNFSRGIQVGKLMAKDYRGVLLVMLAIIRSSKGQAILKRLRNFKEVSDIPDWILLVELMLEWESYLNEPRMYMKHVKRLEKKHRYIMYIMRRVAQREAGMGLKLVKFHMILHIWEDIIQFGVPLEFDTAANEQHHKSSKRAARRTQRAADTFNFQTAVRLVEYELLDLAMAEIEDGLIAWEMNYSDESKDSDKTSTSSAGIGREVSTGETGIQVLRDDDGQSTYKLRTKSKYSNKTRWNSELVAWLLALQDKVQGYIPTKFMPIWTNHQRKGQMFRGHPNFRGKGPWRDWAWIDWGGDYGKLPCHIWCFLELERMPKGRDALEYGGICLKDGTYAVVETSKIEEDVQELGSSDLMMPVNKDAVMDGKGEVQQRIFYLADVEAIVDPCCCIPDIGGPKNRYFVVKPRNQWSDLFIKWIEDPHNLDAMDDLDEAVADENKLAHLESENT